MSIAAARLSRASYYTNSHPSNIFRQFGCIHKSSIHTGTFPAFTRTVLSPRGRNFKAVNVGTQDYGQRLLFRKSLSTTAARCSTEKQVKATGKQNNSNSGKKEILERNINMSDSTAPPGVDRITDWADKETGEFKRKPSVFRNKISREPGAEYPPEKGRYHLYVSYACPWAHRTLIVRALKGLESIIDFTVVHWHMDSLGWRFVTAEDALTGGPNVRPDHLHNFKRLRDLYFKVNPEYTGRFTVPVLWDTKTQSIVNNESSEIIRMLYTEFDDLVEDKYKGLEFLKGRTEEVDELNSWVYDDVNNGVYKAGFAISQTAYDSAVLKLFTSLDRIEAILSKSTYLLGEELTEADIRLYPTIVRFDPVYVQHFKCNIKDIRHDYPAIHRWLRHLYWDIKGFKETTEFNHIKYHYTKSHPQINPHGITPAGPMPHILLKDA